jgi:hypothetical protein
MGDLLISDEVADLVGPAVTEQAVETATDFLCALCRTSGDVRRPEGAALIVERYRDGRQRVLFAHPQCVPSQVIEVDLPTPRLGTAEQDVRTVAGILPGPSFRPILVLQFLRSVSVMAGGAPPVGIIDGLLHSGLHRVGNIQAPPPPAIGWTMTLDGFDQGQITDADGATVLGPKYVRDPAGSRLRVRSRPLVRCVSDPLTSSTEGSRPSTRTARLRCCSGRPSAYLADCHSTPDSGVPAGLASMTPTTLLST